MPTYDFKCNQCGAEREALVDYHLKDDLELLCSACGGVMTIAPVSTLNLILQRGDDPKIDPRPARVKACGHTHHCRCSIKMTSPNPFQRQIDRALGRQNSE